MSPDEMRIKLPFDELGSETSKQNRNIPQKSDKRMEFLENQQDVDHLDPNFILGIQITHTKGKIDIHVDYASSSDQITPNMRQINRNLLKSLRDLF
jgi:hypothetical protein